MRKYLMSLLIGLMLLMVTPFAYAEDPVKIFVNSQELKSDVPPQVINDRVMVPVRFVAEALGAGVVWSDSSVYIATNESPQSNSISSKWPSEWPSEWQNTNKTVTTGTEKDLFYSYLIFNKGLSVLTTINKDNFEEYTDHDKWLYLGALSIIDNANNYIINKEFPAHLKNIQSDMLETYAVNKASSWLIWQAMLDENDPESALKALRSAKAVMEYESSITTKRPSYVWYDNNRLSLGAKYGNPETDEAISGNKWEQWLKDNAYRIKTFPKTEQ